MHSALRQSRTNDKFQDPLFLFLELVRAGVLHWNLWGGRAYSGGPSFGDEDEKKCMLLVMRVISLVPLNTKVSLKLVQPHPRSDLYALYSPSHGLHRCLENSWRSIRSIVPFLDLFVSSSK
jgi:hypothetical protein